MRRQANPFTEREAEIMQFLWSRDRATAEEIRGAMKGQPHDSTVRTLLRVLEEKRHVTHEAVGKVYHYRPVTQQVRAQKTALRNLLTQFFGGSAENLVLRLIEEDELSADELRELLDSAPANKRRPKGDKP
ncbi:MAG: BlaI/MecI/CopY family transcriptional regulator [Gemmataceae bacterium]